MPETLDFQEIADRIVSRIDVRARGGGNGPADIAWVAEQLRLVWNIRGATDVAKLDTELSILMGGTASGPYTKNLDRALRSLDR